MSLNSLSPAFSSRWALPALWLLVSGQGFSAAPIEEDYNQWKQALNTNAATAAEHLTALPGFTVELLRSAQPGEGSWVAMVFDPRGRIIIAREERGLLRLTLPANSAAPIRVETINTNLLECRGLLFAYDSLYVNANNSKGLYRLRDTKGDGQFDEVKLLRATPGGVGHGRNQLALGPDGLIYSIHGDDVRLPPEGAATNSPFRHYAEDRLLPCEWDKHLFNAEAKMPFGHLIRTDQDGKTWELVAGGLRNPFGLDFNPAGDLFTFDADMEWDAGLSWYHPTRVLQLVPGGDYGWRRGTGVLPVWSPDTLPSVVDIGLASPTAVKFGTKSNFPEPWRQALFILDWAYGKIHAIHLTRSGAGYTGRPELFLKGRPLNVTGLDFGPDGAMYLVTGGRRTQSGLYRVKWAGPASGATPSKTTPSPGERLESKLAADLSGASMDLIWSQLNASDLWLRHQARIALESRPIPEWRERALTEARPSAAFTGLLALARAGESALQAAILQRLDELVSSTLTADQQLMAIRAAAVAFIRHGKPARPIAERFLAKWEPLYPAADPRVNQSLCELLVYLESTHAVQRTLRLLASAATQEEQFHYLFTLRLVKSGWTLPERASYFDGLARARLQFHGANMLPTALNYIRTDAEATLTSAERAALAGTLAMLDRPAAPAPAAVSNRPFIKEWTMPEVAVDLDAAGHGRNAARGRRLFAEAGCAQCHRLGSEGGVIGPDLTSVSARFDRRALLESIIEPSKVIAEVYRNVSLTLKSGAIVDGRIVSEDLREIVVATNPVDPDQRRRVAKADLAAQRVSDLSPMPADLLNTLTREEILDLLAWVESGGEATHRDFKP